MGEAIGQSLATAVGVAISPFPIIAVVLMLATSKGRVNGPAFLLGWLLGLAVLGTIVLLLAEPANPSESGGPATWVSWLKVLLGVLLLVVAVRQFRARPGPGDEAALPAWMGRIDRVRPPAALGLGAFFAGVNPKNFLLVVSGATAIAQTGIPAGQQAVAYAVFAIIGSAGVAVPLAIYVGMGERAPKTLARLKDWLGLHNAVIMSVLCTVIAAKLIGDALAALTA